MKRSPYEQGEIKAHQIILALNLTPLKFNGLLTVEVYEIQSTIE